ncbi:MAG TPA: hypothetical protein PLL12_10350 [Aestuariivirga sp.]|nr:hypothetical protein [Aestuariivirga sp.]
MTNSGIKLRILVVLIAIFMAAPTLAFADILGNRDRDILKAGGTVTRVAPNWRIVCMRKGGEPWGVASRHKHCRLEKNDFRVLALMTKDGLSIPYLPSRPACGGYPGKMRVDWRPIGSLPLQAKITALSRGTTFGRPYQTPWPLCQPTTEYTGLYRFPAALARLKAEWRKFR